MEASRSTASCPVALTSNKNTQPDILFPKHPSFHHKNPQIVLLLLPTLHLFPSPISKMEENGRSKIRDPHLQVAELDLETDKLHFGGFSSKNGEISIPNNLHQKRAEFSEKNDVRVLQNTGSNAARYKMMSPAKLPITRSPCLTIPAGLSPTTLLDSPVFLSNMKAEPSPTTGTFSVPPITNDAIVSDVFSSPRDTSNSSNYDEGISADFEFKHHIKSCKIAGLSSLETLASIGSDYLHCKQFAQLQGQFQSHSLASSPSVTAESAAVSSHDLTLSVTPLNPPAYVGTFVASAPSDITSDEPWHGQGLEGGFEASQSDHKAPNPLVLVERSSEDGYNWRKYGQKYVKGSEFPRSYYKCTHPNCQMKKQLERSHDGQITEIIYKGCHDHPKPQPSRRLAVGAIICNPGEERTEGLIGSEDKRLNVHGQTSHHVQQYGAPEPSPVSVSDDDVEGGHSRSNRIGDEVDDDDDPESKRRKKDIGGIDVTPMGKVTREPRVVVQTMSEVDILDDGYRWRKYGQKVVKGNPNPRSYYKCTNAGCSVRKHVERASHDPKAVITTYEGKHNHDVPATRTSSHDTTGPAVLNDANATNGHLSATLSDIIQTEETTRIIHQLYNQSEESDVISLDLGVGISLSSENRSNEKHQTLDKDQTQSHVQITEDAGCGNIQATPVPAYYGTPRDGTNHYESKEEQAESFSFNPPPLNHSSNTYQQSIGRLVLGP